MRRIPVALLVAAGLVTSLVAWQSSTSGGSSWVQASGVLETEDGLNVSYSIAVTEPVVRTLIPNEVIRVVAVSTTVKGGSVALQHNLDIRRAHPDSVDAHTISVGPVNLANIPMFAAETLGMEPEAGSEDMSATFSLVLQPVDGITWGEVAQSDQIVVSLQAAGR